MEQYSTVGDLFYVSAYIGRVTIKEYWKIGCTNDDIVIAAGYVETFKTHDYSEISGEIDRTIYLNPADIRKKWGNI